MNIRRFAPAIGAALVFANGAAHAEPFSFYDKFNELKTINNDLWMENEVTRVILNKQLLFGMGVAGGITSDLGNKISTQAITFANSVVVTQIATDMTIDFVDAPASCGDSRFVSYAKLKIGGAFFNIGTPTPNSSTGDIVGQIVLTRLGNSPDAPGVVNVAGEVLQCKNSNCLSYTTLGTVDLGQAEMLKPVGRLYLSWDQASKSFIFQRTANGPKLAWTYTLPDTSAPGKPSKTFSIRNAVPNCADSSPPLVTKITARIDNVAVNEGAAPE